MDRQSVHGGGAGGGAATQAQEWLYAGAEVEQQAVDGAFFLMELLEDNGAPAAEYPHPPEDADDRLSRVIRSLETEIGGLAGGGAPSSPAPEDRGSAATEHAPSEDVLDGCLEDALASSDLRGSPGPCAAEAALPAFEYWAESLPAAAGHVDLGGWYVDVDGVAVGAPYEFREHCYYGYSESPAAEHVHGPLWE